MLTLSEEFISFFFCLVTSAISDSYHTLFVDQLAISNPRASVMEKLHSSNFLIHLGIEWIFMSIDEAVQVCSTLQNQESV